MSLWYEGSKKFWIGNPKYHMYLCCGQRGRGKTSVWLKECYNWYKKDPSNNKFVYLRRKEKQLELASELGIIGGSQSAYPEDWEGVTGELVKKSQFSLITADKQTLNVGYTVSLNNVKGLSIEDANVLLFDEFVEPSRGDYKGGGGGVNEPELFARLIDTIFRKRECWIILLGNYDSPTNPYFEYFNIPYNSHGWSDKERGIIFEEDVSRETAVANSETTLGKLFSGTRYSQYSNGEIALGQVDDSLIFKDIPSHCKLLYNISAFGKKLTLWQDEDAFQFYLTDKREFDKNLSVLSVTSDDMVVNSFFLQYSSDVIITLRVVFGRGRLRFNSQQTASTFLNILKIGG